MPDVIVCLPTYNERENLEAMVRGARSRTATAILVVDDNSPDGTGEIADRLAAELGFVSVLHRPEKEGLGPACIAGFERALADGAEIVVEMDSDFSHDPADVPRLVAAIEGGADLALGSRYVKGGGTVNWGLGRRVLSRGASIYGRTILGVKLHDVTAGFTCYRRERARGARPRVDRLAGLRLPDRDEVPRAPGAASRSPRCRSSSPTGQQGKSKMTRAIILEAFWKVPLLRVAAVRGEL